MWVWQTGRDIACMLDAQGASYKVVSSLSEFAFPLPYTLTCVPLSLSLHVRIHVAAAAQRDVQSPISILGVRDNVCYSPFTLSPKQLQNVKVIRNKATGYSEGYGFIEFATHAAALNALQTFHGASMPQTEGQLFKLNWAQFGGSGGKPMGGGYQQDAVEYSIFVGDLDMQVRGRE